MVCSQCWAVVTTGSNFGQYPKGVYRNEPCGHVCGIRIVEEVPL